MSLETPVVLLIYRRPELTAQALAHIGRVRPRRLLVVGDGPRPDVPGDEARVRAARQVIERVDWPCEVITHNARTNLGCQRRVASGLDWVFSQFEEAIVIEDDCLPEASFFSFCTQMLERYRTHEQVLSIGGANFQAAERPVPHSYYFSQYFRCWGWASWRRAWLKFDATMRDWPTWKNSEAWRACCPTRAEQRFWRFVFDGVHQGRIDSWAYPFCYASFRCGGLHVQPAVNLVSNVGFDASATNTAHPQHRFANYPVTPLEHMSHPPAIVRDIAADQHTFATVYGGYRAPRLERWRASLAKRGRRVWQWGADLARMPSRLRLRRRLARSSNRRLIIGASSRSWPGWIATDQQELDLLRPRDWESQFPPASLDALLAEHVWEHLSLDQGLAAARLAFRFLQPGGHLRVAVPDGCHPSHDYREWVRPGGTGPGAADHKVLYTSATLAELFARAGFAVRLLEYFDEQGQFHAREWDPEQGMIVRSQRFDPRNAGGELRYTSLILDAIKPPQVTRLAESVPCLDSPSRASRAAAPASGGWGF